MTVKEDFRKYVAQTSDHSIEFEVSKAEGAYIWDETGKKYLDFHAGVGVMNYGHGNQLIKEAVKEQMDKYAHTLVYGEHIHESTVQYAKAIALSLEGQSGVEAQKQVFFVNSGNESIDLAIKMSRKLTKRKGLVALKKAFHGRGYGSMQLTWNEQYKEGFFVDDGDTDWVDPFAEDVEGELDKVDWNAKAAAVAEFVQGEGGAVAVPIEFLKAVRKRCTDHGVKFVADEVQTGFGRTGDYFAQLKFGVEPDITCIGKAGGGGLPFGGVVARQGDFEDLQKPALSHISTFGGNPVVCAAGLAGFIQLGPRLFEKMAEVVSLLEDEIEKIHDDYPHIVDHLSGVGLMRGLVLSDSSLTDKFYWKCVEKGLLLHFKLNAGRTLRMSPPLIITEEHVAEASRILREVCEELQ